MFQSRKQILFELAPEPHPLKERLSELGVKQILAARFLDVPLTTLNFWLNGINPMPKEKEQRLRLLCVKLENAEVNK